MKTYSKLTLAFLLLILVVPPVVAEGPPKDGPYVEYYGNGQKKREAHYKNGKQEGLSTTWYGNGQKEYEFNHKDGKLDGRWLRWRSNGSRLEEGDYKKGKRHGWFDFFDEEDIWSDNQEYIEGKPQWF